MLEESMNPETYRRIVDLNRWAMDKSGRLRSEMLERAFIEEISALKAARLEGMEEGRRKAAVDSIIMALRFRFQSVSESVRKRLAAVSELELLHTILKKALASDSPEEFERFVASL